MTGSAVSFSDVVCAALDPLLTPYGFARGQGGDAYSPENTGGALAWFSTNPDDTPPAAQPPSGRLVTSITFCASFDGLAPLARSLARTDYDVGQGYCVDITVGGNPRIGITRVEYEGRSIDAVLDEIGLTEDAGRCRQAPSGSLAEDLDTLAGALSRLLELTQGAIE